MSEDGYLKCYSRHGVGTSLLQLGDPSKVIAVGDEWILQPEEEYEITGYVHNVEFCCGAVPEDDGSVKIYWGRADKVMCVGTASLEALVDHCLDHSRPPH